MSRSRSRIHPVSDEPKDLANSISAVLPLLEIAARIASLSSHTSNYRTVVRARAYSFGSIIRMFNTLLTSYGFVVRKSWLLVVYNMGGSSANLARYVPNTKSRTFILSMTCK